MDNPYNIVMNTAQLHAAIDELPSNLQEQVYNFVTFLKSNQAKQITEPQEARILGLHKGSMYMHDDFDDPLPDAFWLGEE